MGLSRLFTTLALTAIIPLVGCGCPDSQTTAATEAPPSVSSAAEVDVTALPAETEAATAKLAVTASSWEQKAHGGFADFPPELSIDGNLKTSWRAEGKGQWIQFDLGSVRKITGVKIAFVGGDQRQYTLDIAASRTGAEGDWNVLHDKVTSSGTTAEPESFPIGPVAARYVRLVGHGNTSEKFPEWFNITEMVIVAE